MSDIIDDAFDMFHGVSIIINPHEDGFTLGIIDPKAPGDSDLCSLVAKGIVKFVTSNPGVIYDQGMLAEAEIDDERVITGNNVIDLFKFKSKKDLN